MLNLPMTLTSYDFSKFDETEYFKDFHYYEKYDESKQYTKENFETDYGKGLHTYLYKYYTINNLNDPDKKEFVVADEILSGEERIELIKHCNCEVHQANTIDRRLMCACCYGCLIAGKSYDRQHIIDSARERQKLGIFSDDLEDIDLNFNLYYLGLIGVFFLSSYVYFF